MEIISSKIPSDAKSEEGKTCTKSILKELTFKIVVFRKRVSHLAEHVRRLKFDIIDLKFAD